MQDGRYFIPSGCFSSNESIHVHTRPAVQLKVHHVRFGLAGERHRRPKVPLEIGRKQTHVRRSRHSLGLSTLLVRLEPPTTVHPHPQANVSVRILVVPRVVIFVFVEISLPPNAVRSQSSPSPSLARLGGCSLSAEMNVVHKFRKVVLVLVVLGVWFGLVANA
jgi:hypothetical protein